jgi:DNA mismatch endonuclease (patch repair protein)
LATNPGTNAEFWSQKFERNVARDRQVREEVARYGYEPITIWECEITEQRLEQLAYHLKGKSLD